MNLDQIKKNVNFGDYDILQKLLKTSSVSIAKQKFLRGDKEALEAMIVIQENRTIFPYLHDEFYELENLLETISNKADKTYVDQKIQNVSLTPGTNATISGATATVRNTVGTPTVAVVSGGTSSNRSFSFTFSNIKGDKGDTGPQGPSGNSENRTTVQNIYKIDRVIDLEANKTRVLITEKDIVQIEKGKRDGDELILCGYGQGWETRVSIPWMDRSGKVLKDLVFNVDRTMHFWWSDKEASWLDISTNVSYK